MKILDLDNIKNVNRISEKYSWCAKWKPWDNELNEYINDDWINSS